MPTAKPKDDPTRKHVCVQVAPAVRVAIAETLGLAPGATTPKQLAEGLRRLGFDEVGALAAAVPNTHLPAHRLPVSTLACMLGASAASLPPRGLAAACIKPACLPARPHAQVFDTLFGADLTIMEEGSELLHRLTEHLEAHPHSDEPLPMFTSCCPGWIGEQRGVLA